MISGEVDFLESSGSILLVIVAGVTEVSIVEVIVVVVVVAAAAALPALFSCGNKERLA